MNYKIYSNPKLFPSGTQPATTAAASGMSMVCRRVTAVTQLALPEVLGITSQTGYSGKDEL